jgi:hypothetical protein
MVQLNRPNFIHYTMLNVPARHRPGTSSQSEATTPFFDDFGKAHEAPSVPVSHRNSRFWPSLPTTGLASTYFATLTIPTAPISTRDACVHDGQRALHLHPTTPLVTSSNANVNTRIGNRDSSLSYAQDDHGGFGSLRIINEVDKEDPWGMAMTPTLDDYEFTFEQEDTESVFSFDWGRPVGQVHRNMGVWLGRKVGRVFRRR